MDQDFSYMVAASKVPMLKPENGAILPKIQVLEGVTTVMPITLVVDKAQRRLEKNEADLDTLSMDDLYNNLKVYEPEVKGMSSSNSNTQNMAFLSSINNSNNGTVNTAQAVNTANEVSTTSTQVYAAFFTNIDNLSDVIICSFLASQPNSLQLAHEDLKQIHPDDIKEIDLRWKMSMLTMRAKRALRNQDTKHKESIKRSVPVETPALIALVLCDGVGGYDWSDQAEERPNYALMAYTSLSSNSKKSKLMVLGYKTGLQSVKKRLEIFKKNEFIYLEDIKVLKVEIQIKDIAIKVLKRKLEVAQKEKNGIQLTVEKLKNASKSLNKLIDNCKKGLGYKSYNAVPPPYTGNFMPPKPDLSYTILDKFAIKHIVENKSSEEETKTVRKNDDALIIKEWVSNDKEENVTQPKIVKKTVMPSIVKKEFVKPRQ
nr:hypothetical protein [Tanacetum cinerariifolium]